MGSATRCGPNIGAEGIRPSGGQLARWRPMRPPLRKLADVQTQSPENPSMLLVSIPKSGTVYLNKVFVETLGLKNFICSNQYFPEDQLNFDLMLEFSRGGYFSSVHIDPSPANLQLLNVHVPRWVVHLRDPRSVLVSLTHHMQRLFNEGRHRDLLRLAPSPPAEYYSASFSDRIDWGIEYFLPPTIEWILEWLAVADEAPERVRLTEYRNLVENEADLLDQISSFVGVFRRGAPWQFPERTMDAHFRTGRTDEWRDVLNARQLAACSATIPGGLKARFNWV